MPVTLMSVGKDYVEGYLLKENKGGGFYIEYHDAPHFHMPLNPDSTSSHLILGKREGDEVFLSAFTIPYGSAIYPPANVIHDDGFLSGDLSVIYSITDSFSTVILKTENDDLVDVKVIAI